MATEKKQSKLNTYLRGGAALTIPAISGAIGSGMKRGIDWVPIKAEERGMKVLQALKNPVARKEILRSLRAPIKGGIASGLVVGVPYAIGNELYLRARPQHKTASRDLPSFTSQNRPEKVKKVYKALKREHPDMPAEIKARIASKFGPEGVQKKGPPYKGEINYQYKGKGEYEKLKNNLTKGASNEFLIHEYTKPGKKSLIDQVGSKNKKERLQAQKELIDIYMRQWVSQNKDNLEVARKELNKKASSSIKPIGVASDKLVRALKNFKNMGATKKGLARELRRGLNLKPE